MKVAPPPPLDTGLIAWPMDIIPVETQSPNQVEGERRINSPSDPQNFSPKLVPSNLSPRSLVSVVNYSPQSSSWETFAGHSPRSSDAGETHFDILQSATKKLQNFVSHLEQSGGFAGMNTPSRSPKSDELNVNKAKESVNYLLEQLANSKKDEEFMSVSHYFGAKKVQLAFDLKLLERLEFAQAEQTAKVELAREKMGDGLKQKEFVTVKVLNNYYSSLRKLNQKTRDQQHISLFDEAQKEPEPADPEVEQETQPASKDSEEDTIKLKLELLVAMLQAKVMEQEERIQEMRAAANPETSEVVMSGRKTFEQKVSGLLDLIDKLNGKIKNGRDKQRELEDEIYELRDQLTIIQTIEKEKEIDDFIKRAKKREPESVKRENNRPGQGPKSSKGTNVNDENYELLIEIERLQEDFDTVVALREKEVAHAKQVESKLRQRLANMKKEMDILSDDDDEDLEAEIENLKEIVARLEKEKNHIKHQMERQIKDLQARLDHSQASMQALLETKEASQEGDSDGDDTGAEPNISNPNSDSKEMEKQMISDSGEKATGSNDEEQSQSTEAAPEGAQTPVKPLITKEELEELTQKLIATEAAKQELDEEVNRLLKEIETTKESHTRALDRAEGQILTYKEQVNQTKAELSTLHLKMGSQKTAAHQEKVAAKLKKDNELLAAEIDSLKASLTETQSQNDLLLATVSKQEELSVIISEQNVQIEELKREVETQAENNNNLVAENQKMKNKGVTLRALTEKLDAARGKIAEQEDALRASRNQIEQVRSETEQMLVTQKETLLEEAAAVKNTLVAELQSAQKEAQKISEHLSQVEKELAEHKKSASVEDPAVAELKMKEEKLILEIQRMKEMATQREVDLKSNKVPQSITSGGYVSRTQKKC